MVIVVGPMPGGRGRGEEKIVGKCFLQCVERGGKVTFPTRATPIETERERESKENRRRRRKAALLDGFHKNQFGFFLMMGKKNICVRKRDFWFSLSCWFLFSRPWFLFHWGENLPELGGGGGGKSIGGKIEKVT